MKVDALDFLIPDPTSFYSGGNLYNQQLVDALKASGSKVRLLSIADLGAVKPEVPTTIFVDTLFWDQLPLLAKISPKVLIVHHLESLFPPSGWQSRDYFLQFEQKKLEKFDAFLCTSNYTRQYLHENGLHQPCFVVLPAIGFKCSPTKIKLDKIKAIIVANLVERKGLLPFLKVLNQQETPQWLNQLRITMVGGFDFEPDYAQACLQVIENSQVLRNIIDVKGALSHKETLSEYHKANLFISTSLMETFGMAIQEASVFGLPVLALNGGNTANHFLSSKVGMLFQNHQALVKQLKLFCQNPGSLESLREEGGSIEKTRGWNDAAAELLAQMEHKPFVR